MELWMMSVNWIMKLYSRRQTYANLNQMQVDAKELIYKYVDVFSKDEFSKYNISISFWNLHYQLYITAYCAYLGSLYLLNTTMGE